jgi:hypothetical protein
MGTSERKEELRSFLAKMELEPVVLSEGRNLGLMEEFIVTYFGMCHVEGFRVLEKIGQNVFLLKKMGLGVAAENGRGLRLVCVEYKDKINEDRTLREARYQQLLGILEYFGTGPSCENV